MTDFWMIPVADALSWSSHIASCGGRLMSPATWYRSLGLGGLLAVLALLPALSQDTAKGTKYALLAGVRSHAPARMGKPGKEITNSIGMKFVRIPAGKFTMGSPRKEREEVLKQLREKG